MAKSIKLGSDTYLDARGVTMNNRGTTLPDYLSPVTGNYTPTFSLDNNGSVTVTNILFSYCVIGNLLIINGRFYVDSWNGNTNCNLQFSLPSISGVPYETVLRGAVGTVGMIVRGNTAYPDQALQMRVTDSTKIAIYIGAGGYSVPDMSRTYYSVGVYIPILRT